MHACALVRCVLKMKTAFLLILLLGANVRTGEAKQASYDREDDDFAEFDFDIDEEWEQGEPALINAHSRTLRPAVRCVRV